MILLQVPLAPPTDEMFESSVRSKGDLSGVFEFDGDSSYFYLYRVDGDEGNKVVDAIRIGVGNPAFAETAVAIRWSLDESLVALVVGDDLTALFDCVTGKQYGGLYSERDRFEPPADVIHRLQF